MPRTRLSSITHLHATNFIRKMGGGAQSFLTECSDGHYYVLKLLGNPQGTNVLANELLGSILMGSVGLPTTRPSLVTVSRRFLDENPGVYFAGLRGNYRPESGLHFGSRFVGELSGAKGPKDLLPPFDLQHTSDRSAFLGMYLFDIWAQHRDRRQAVFAGDSTLRPLNAVFIDHGHLFGGPNWNMREPYKGARWADMLFYKHLWSDKAVDEWTHVFLDKLPEVLSSAGPTIPDNWYKGNLNSVIATLQARLQHIRTIFRMPSGRDL